MGSNFYLAIDQKSKPTPRFLGFLPDEFLRSCLCIEQEPPIMSSIPLEVLSFQKLGVDEERKGLISNSSQVISLWKKKIKNILFWCVAVFACVCQGIPFVLF
jgi:hypothetical protein